MADPDYMPVLEAEMRLRDLVDELVEEIDPATVLHGELAVMLVRLDRRIARHIARKVREERRDRVGGAGLSRAEECTERMRLKMDWRATSTFAELRDSFLPAIGAGAATRLADAGLSLNDIPTISDTDLLAIPYVGELTVAALRAHIAKTREA